MIAVSHARADILSLGQRQTAQRNRREPSEYRCGRPVDDVVASVYRVPYIRFVRTVVFVRVYTYPALPRVPILCVCVDGSLIVGYNLY